MRIQNTSPGDFPVFWQWFRAQDTATQTAHIKALINEQNNMEYGLAALAEGHPALPKNAGPLAKVFLGRTLL